MSTPGRHIPCSDAADMHDWILLLDPFGWYAPAAAQTALGVSISKRPQVRGRDYLTIETEVHEYIDACICDAEAP